MPFVETNGIRMYYTDQGSGSPLLLIMGITATGGVWEKHSALWSTRFRCIMPDNRGVGLSDAPPGSYTSEQMADDYAGLIEALRIEKIRVVGCSMGSIIAQQLAIRHPEKIESVVFMCPWARCDAKAIAIFQHMVTCKRKLAPEDFALFIQSLIFSKSYWDNPQHRDAMEQDRASAAIEENPQTILGLEGQAAACMLHNEVENLCKIYHPTLVIGGSEDIFTPPWMAKEMADHLPAATIHLYDGCGHAFHWEALDDFNPRILNWLIEH